MLTKTRRRRWLPAVCAVGVLLCAVALNLRGDRTTTSDESPKSASKSASLQPSPLLTNSNRAVELMPKRLPYIVQGEGAAVVRSAVRDVGGLVTSDLSVIRAVGAAIDDRELAALRDRGVPHLRIYDDTPVHASSPAGTLPETYYPCEVDAKNLHVGAVTGHG